jgi:nitrite reductase/ring-hydroxylating ferredoxin subunit
MRHVLFPLAELGSGEARPVKVGKTEIVVVRTERGEVFALRDRCPHAGAKLSRGRVLEKVIEGDDGGYALSPEECILRCPWHAYEFDLATGLCDADPKHVRVKSYPVSVEEGMVVLER